MLCIIKEHKEIFLNILGYIVNTYYLWVLIHILKLKNMNEELIRLYRIARATGCKAKTAIDQARAWVKLGVTSKNIVLIED